MIPLALVALAVAPAAAPPRVPLDAIPFDRARQLDGRRVTAAFLVGAPPYTLDTARGPLTVTGPGDRGDGVEWTAVLKGNRRAAAAEGERVAVTGTLRVIRHRAAFVGGAWVPPWVEVRVEENR